MQARSFSGRPARRPRSATSEARSRAPASATRSRHSTTSTRTASRTSSSPRRPRRTRTGTITCYSGATRVPIYTTTGTTPLGAFGYSIARLSDLDGDGVRDFAAGAPYANAGRRLECRPGPRLLGRDRRDPAHDQRRRPANDAFGLDHVGGRRHRRRRQGGPDRGSAHGAVGSAHGSCPGATGAILRTHTGTVLYGAFGFGVCGLRDLDNDGVADYAIASPSLVSVGGDPGPRTCLLRSDGDFRSARSETRQ